MQNYGQNWTLSQASEFIAACYDRDALLETLINFGASWLKGRLICLISSNTLQPFSSKGWSSWLDDEETTKAFNKLRHTIEPETVLDEVVKKNHHTFGSPEILGITIFFDETGVLPPEHLMVLPIKLGNKTKVLFFGEPSFEVKDLQTFSVQAAPMVQLAQQIGKQLEEIIRLAKTKQLPPKDQRIPEVNAPELSPAEVFENADPHDLESYMPISTPIEVENPLADDSEETIDTYSAKTAPVRITPEDLVPPTEEDNENRPSPITQANTQEYQPEPNVRQTVEQVGRPVPVSYDPDDKPQDESTGVNIMVPIGISDVAVSSKQTLLGGFSAEDLRKAMDEYAQEQQVNNRMTLQGFKLKQPLKPNKGIEAVERIEDSDKLEAPDPTQPKQELTAPVKPKDEQPKEVEGKPTQRVKVTDVLLSQDIKSVPNTQQMHAVEGPVEEPAQEEALPQAEPSTNNETQESTQPKKSKTTLDILAPPIPDPVNLEEASVVEELPTLEFELLDEEDEFDGIYEEIAAHVSSKPKQSPLPLIGKSQTVSTQKQTPSEAQPVESYPSVEIEAIEPEKQVEPEQPKPAPMITPVQPTPPKFDVDGFMEIIEGRDRKAAFKAAEQAIEHPELIQRLVKAFPGRLYVDRYMYIPQNMAPVEQHGPLLVALITIGEAVAPYMTPLFTHSSLDVRFYTTYLFTAINAGPNLTQLYERIMDRDGQTRQAAFDAILFNKAHPELEQYILAPLRDLIAPKSDDLTIEIAAKLAGELCDKNSIQPLILALNQRRVRTGQIITHALQNITLQQLPASAVAWHTWWSKAQNESRYQWLLRAMNATSDPIRELAGKQLRQIQGMEIVYNPHMPTASRVRAQQQVKDWLEQRGML